MGYKLENKDIPINHFNLIGYGKNGNVYKYRKEAIKIFPNGEVPDGMLDEKSCDLLKKISTRAILLPRKTAHYNDQFAGYSLKLVQKGNTSGNLTTMTKDFFLTSVSVLENDVELLSKNGVLLDGITPNNVLVSDQIYITDPSRYSFVLDCHVHPQKLLDLNQYQLYLLLCKMITSNLKKSGLSTSQLKMVRQILKEKDEDCSCSEFFDHLLEEDNSIKSFVIKRSQ